MKKTYRQILKCANRLLGFFIALLGFTMCGTHAMQGGDIVVEYGVPSADYHIDGTVKDADTRQPVGQMRVVVQRSGWQPDTLRTDSLGKYALDDSGWPSDEATIIVDDDGGRYEPESKTVTFDFEGDDGGWFFGKASATVDFDVKKAEKP